METLAKKADPRDVFTYSFDPLVEAGYEFYDKEAQARFRKDQTRLTLVIILMWTIVQGITLIKNLFIYNLLSEPIDYTNILTKRAIPWLTGIAFIFIINYTSRYFLKLNIKLIQLPLIHFLLAIVISFIMYISCYYGVISLGMSTFQKSNILKYFMVEIDRLFLIYLLISITTTAFYYFFEIKTKELALIRTQNAYTQSRIVSLNNEVNPHMIFNTLNNIYTLINEDLEYAKKMILDFAQLIRQSLQNKDTIYTTILHERQFLSDYVNLQNNLDKNQYNIDFEYDHNIEDAILPKMLIQPLIENAIKHSNTRPGKTLTIEVSFQKQGEKLVMSVVNRKGNLPYMKTRTDSTGLGTENIKERLRVLYPGNFDYSINHFDHKYITRITIPFET